MSHAAREKSHRFLRFAGVVSAAVTLSRITGLAREMVMARLFGAGAVYDAFLLGMRIPGLTRNLFAEGALSSAFIPVFTEWLARKGKREASALANVTGTALVLIVGAVCAAGMWFSPELVRVMAPGFAQSPEKFELAVLLTRIMFPFLLLVSLSALAMGVLNSCDVYGVPALASAVFNAGSVTAGLALGYTVGRRSGYGPIVSMAWGVLAGGLLQLLWQAPSLAREGFRYRPSLDWRHPGLRQIAPLMVPAVIGSAAFQINLIVNTNFASRITDPAGNVIDGPVSWLGYAFRFLQFPLGLFGVAIASATLPDVSRSAAAARMDEFRASLARSLGLILLLTIPSSVGLAVLSHSMIGAIYEWGKFTSTDTHQTAVALECYSAGLAGYAATKVLAPAFYALNDARPPMLVSLGSISANILAAFVMVDWARMGHAGLALATSIVTTAGAAALYAGLSERAGGLHARALGSSAWRILASSAIMGGVVWLASGGVRAAMGSGKAGQLADLAVSMPLGAAVFYLAARGLRVKELETLQTACYTAFRNASRPEVGDPPARNR